MKRRIDYSTGAQITGILLTLAPLPLILAEFHPELRGEPLWKFIIPPLAVLCGIVGALRLFCRGRYGRICSALFWVGSFGSALPWLSRDPFATLLLSATVLGALFTLWELHLRPFPPEFEVTRPRALAGLLTALGMLLISPFSDQGGAILYRGALAGSTVMALSLFLAWAVRAAHSRSAQWFGAVSIGVILAGFFFGRELELCFGVSAAALIWMLRFRPLFSGSYFWHDVVLGHPARVMFFTFLLLCAAGTLLLSLPAAGNVRISPLDAAFTATSAVCVTGLTVVDTSSDITGVGQFFLLLLIQLGGLGIMSIATIALHVMGRRLSLRQEHLMSSMTDTEQRDLMESLKLVFLYTFGVEAAGAVILTLLFYLHDGELLFALQQGIFTAVSGFCNAGFTICAGNLTAYQNAPLLLYTVGILVVLGGIAPATAVLLPNCLRGRAVPVGAHLALTATAWLIGIGTLAFLVLEWNGVLAGLSPAAKFHNAVFQSVTLRTAGFNSVELGGLHSSTVLISLIWMFIGGSPGGTAGGVKTTTAAVLALVFWADITNRDGITIRNRRIAPGIQRRAATILLAAFLVLLAAVMMLLVTQPLPARELIFEAVSAMGTVGLSLGATAHLDAIGKVIVMLTMFIGRIGPLTIFLLLNDERHGSQSSCPDANITLT